MSTRTKRQYVSTVQGVEEQQANERPSTAGGGIFEEFSPAKELAAIEAQGQEVS